MSEKKKLCLPAPTHYTSNCLVHAKNKNVSDDSPRFYSGLCAQTVSHKVAIICSLVCCKGSLCFFSLSLDKARLAASVFLVFLL